MFQTGYFSVSHIYQQGWFIISSYISKNKTSKPLKPELISLNQELRMTQVK